MTDIAPVEPPPWLPGASEGEGGGGPSPSPSANPPCVEWQGYRDRNGYGRANRNGQKWLMHRYVWTLLNGPIPDGAYVLHHCDNPSCFRLEHLYLGDHAQNMADMKARRRHANTVKTHCAQGHEFTPENTYATGTHRFCRECGRIRTRRWYHTTNKGVAA